MPSARAPWCWRTIVRWLEPFGRFVLIAAALLSLNRLALCAAYARNAGAPGEWAQLLLTGWRFDAITLAYLLAPAWVGFAIVGGHAGRWTSRVGRTYLGAAIALIAFLECAAWPALREFGSRPEGQFLEYLRHGRQVAALVWSGFRIEMAAAALVVTAVAAFAWKALRPPAEVRPPAWPVRALVFGLGSALLFVAARSSFGHRAANLSNAVFSENRLLNELALNSTYTLLYAAYRGTHEARADGDYGRMEPARALARVDSVRAEVRGGAAGSAGETVVPPARLPNIVVLLLESFGAEYTGRHGGTLLTPNYDRLAADGVAFDRLFCTGTRTARGIEAVVTGFFPTPSRSVLKLNLSQRAFYTVPAMLQQAGYRTHFFYGGEANFDEMKSFLANNGVQHIWDQPVVQRPGQAVGVWGVHDEDLFLEVDEILRREPDEPFFALVLSTSNHTPFDYPRGRVAPDSRYPEASAENAIKYTDHALGRFFERARTAPYFENTLFLIVADHGTRVSGDQLIPVYKFHVPACIVGPPHRVPRRAVSVLGSQVDLMPTLLGLTGRRWDHPMQGIDLLTIAADAPGRGVRGRALLQYETHFGYWRDDDLVVLRPGLPPTQFRVESTASPIGPGSYRLQSVPSDADLADEALAHTVLPRWLYRQQLYRLDPPRRLADAAPFAPPAPPRPGP